MALGFSGSNGGISSIYHRVNEIHSEVGVLGKLPLEVSYFVNNVCNLECKHCYVGYTKVNQSLTCEEWKAVFSELMGMGALTFGNVGREPLLSWELTKNLLAFFQERQRGLPALRYGLVTNGLLLSDEIAAEMVKLAPTYLDISMDGCRKSHDTIRGTGTYDRLIANLKNLVTTPLAEKIFISFTLNRINKDNVADVVATVFELGIRNILLSPYVTLDKNDDLYLPDDGIVDILDGIVRGQTVDFDRLNGMNIYVKTDYSTSRGVVEKLKEQGLIDPNNLFQDDYGVLFNLTTRGSNRVIINYLPYDNTFTQAIRISHDGYVSGCLEMFHNDYSSRAAGNVRKTSIGEIVRNAAAKKFTSFSK